MSVLLISFALFAAPTLAPAGTTSASFEPNLFFKGRTQGKGMIAIATSSRPRALSVQGTGRIDTDGTLVLDQAIMIDAKPSTRTFRLREIGENIWRGTLTGAAGPVSGVVAGPTLTLRYRMKGVGLTMNQTLTLRDDGRTVANAARVTMMGVTVARIAETIVKLD